MTQALWIPAPENHNFPTVADWFKGLARLRATFAGGTGPYPQALVETAESVAHEYLNAMAPPALLHGDLHHMNIIRAALRFCMKC